jgi:sporulation protein YlmC with PRC-barrel domain
MRSKLLIGGLLASALIVPAFAQSTNQTPSTNQPSASQPAPSANQPSANQSTQRPANTTAQTMPKPDGNTWRASKLVGLDIYNEQNEKLGDVNEVLIDKSGKVQGFVIGVGGFLGMGEHNIMVEMSKLKFVNEPVKSASTTTTTTGTGNRPAGTTGTTSTTSTTQSNGNKWVPDHAVLAGMNKEQLKAMPQFKF